jgi:hypothetical protein
MNEKVLSSRVTLLEVFLKQALSEKATLEKKLSVIREAMSVVAESRAAQDEEVAFLRTLLPQEPNQGVKE